MKCRGNQKYINKRGKIRLNAPGDKSIWTLCLNTKIERNAQKHLTLLLFETDWIKYIITQNPYLFSPLHCFLSLKCGKEWQGKVTMFLFVSSIRELEERQPIWRWNLGKEEWRQIGTGKRKRKDVEKTQAPREMAPRTKYTFKWPCGNIHGKMKQDGTG